MREWFVNLFKQDIGSIRMNAFDGWHFLYIILILGTAIGVTFILKNKSEETKHKTVNAFLTTAIVLYVLDFFCMPFVCGHIDMDKLPFHICTSMSIIACFAQFNKNFNWLKTPSVVLCIVASLMYLTYPGTALNGKFPFCYTVMQTMFYHGALFVYGFLALSTGEVKLNIKNVWKEILLILFIALWASFGNYFYKGIQNSDWFFLQNGAYIFPAGTPQWLIPIGVITSVYLMCLLIYGIYYLVSFIAKKISNSKQNKLQVANASANTEAEVKKAETKEERTNETEKESVEKKSTKN